MCCLHLQLILSSSKLCGRHSRVAELPLLQQNPVPVPISSQTAGLVAGGTSTGLPHRQVSCWKQCRGWPAVHQLTGLLQRGMMGRAQRLPRQAASTSRRRPADQPQPQLRRQQLLQPRQVLACSGKPRAPCLEANVTNACTAGASQVLPVAAAACQTPTASIPDTPYFQRYPQGRHPDAEQPTSPPAQSPTGCRQQALQTLAAPTQTPSPVGSPEAARLHGCAVPSPQEEGCVAATEPSEARARQLSGAASTAARSAPPAELTQLGGQLAVTQPVGMQRASGSQPDAGHVPSSSQAAAGAAQDKGSGTGTSPAAVPSSAHEPQSPPAGLPGTSSCSKAPSVVEQTQPADGAGSSSQTAAGSLQQRSPSAEAAASRPPQPPARALSLPGAVDLLMTSPDSRQAPIPAA